MAEPGPATPDTPGPGSEFFNPFFDRNNRECLENMVTKNRLFLVNRLYNVRYILLYLRQDDCFSLGDQEQVLAMTTTVAKTDHLLDLLIRKDLKALQKFFDVLEYNYEECFTKITCQKPRSKPEDWISPDPYRPQSAYSSQMSEFMTSMINIMGQISQDQKHVCEIADKFKSAMKNEQQEEEIDFKNFKTRMHHLKEENVNLIVENHKLKQLLEKQRKYSKKLSANEAEIVSLRRQLRESQEDLANQKMKQTLQRVLHAMTPSEVSEETAKLKSDLVDCDNRVQTLKNNIDQKDRELDILEGKVQEQEQDIVQLNEKILNHTKTIEELESRLYWNERKEISTHAHDRVGLLKEIAHPDEAANARPVLMRQRAEEDGFRRLSKEFDRLSEHISRYSENITPESIQEEPNDYYKSTPIKIRKICSKRESSRVKQPNIMEIELSGDVLNHSLKLSGGNHSGVFISSISPELKSTKGGKLLEVGDLLVKIKNTSAEDVDRTMCIGDNTLEEANRLINSLTGDVKLYAWRKKQDYDEFLKSMKNADDYTGDLFCIYVNSKPHLGASSMIQPMPGDIYLVTDTMSGLNMFAWKARKIDPYTGIEVIPAKQGYIPSVSVTKESLIRKPSNSKKVKTYIYVQPYIAICKRPVILSGMPTLVQATVNALTKESNEFEVLDDSDCLSAKMAENSEKRFILPNQEINITNFTRMNIYPIVIVLGNVNRESYSYVPLYLTEYLNFPDKHELNEEEEKQVKQTIKRIQGQIVWREKNYPDGKERPSAPKYEDLK